MNVVCTNCGARTLARCDREISRTWHGRTYTTKIPFARCTTCDFAPIPVDAVLAFERAVATHVALFGPANGDTFRCLRRSMNLDVEEAARLVQVPLESVLRWEHGRGKVPIASWLLLAELVREQAAREGGPVPIVELTAPPSTRVLARTHADGVFGRSPRVGVA